MKNIIALMICVICCCPAFAGQVDFKAKSALASGKWVKIEVNKTGVYEISYDKLREYGFTNPSAVKVFGKGGNIASENYLHKHMDDLEQTPIMHKGNKIYFYTKGITRDSIKTLADNGKMYIPRANPYSSTGALFLTDATNEQALLIGTAESAPTAGISNWTDKGYRAWFSNKELYNPGFTGQMFLGDEFSGKGEITYIAETPALSKNGYIYATNNFALIGSESMEMYCDINGTELTRTSTNLMSKNETTAYLEYGLLCHSAKYDLTNLTADGNTLDYKLRVKTAGTLKKAWMDYISLVYPTTLTLPDNMPQINHYVDIDGNTGVKFAELPSETTAIWLVNEQLASSEVPYNVKACNLVSLDDGSKAFAFNSLSNRVELVLFDTAKTQLEPTYIGEVENQNLHGITEIPDMLIITNSFLKGEAERLAQFHKEHDGLEVLVVEQDQIFNEFSAGVRDAMAYRLFCKMLYDRDPQRFKYLLLFGNGTYDNRMIYTDKESEQLLTYQSETGANQTKSYCSDDFFGFLDNSASPYTNRKLQIAVGRIPFSAQWEAANYVDKVIRYCREKEGTDTKWLNNIMLIAEDGDGDIHVDQCESFSRKLMKDGNYDINNNKLYLACYDDPYTVRDKFLEYLNAGQYFGLFIGHGAPTSITRAQIISDLTKGKETKYPLLPIMYFSTCDVARYDNGSSNIVHNMLTNSDGGIIAAIASTRVVYTNLNGKLSDSFATSMAKTDEYYNGHKTLGSVYMDAKNNCTDLSINRLKYCILGDPALSLTHPDNRAILTKINDVILSGSTQVKTKIGETVTLKGVITNADGSTNEAFNGEATIQFYDNEKFYLAANITNENNVREMSNVYSRGKMLNQTKAKVTNGIFTCSLNIPEYSETGTGGVITTRIIAKENGGAVVSGVNRNIYINRTSYPEIAPDTTDPVINALYINDKESFIDGMTVPANFVICGEVSDDNGLNTCTESFISSMTISIDNGKKISPVYGYSPESESSGSFSMPFYGMENGRHTAELTVTDMQGNVCRKVISFIVDNSKNREIIIEQRASASSIIIDTDDYTGINSANIVVKDFKGDVVLNAPVSSFPYEWDLIGNNGEKVQPGNYDIYAVINNIGTKIKKIVVLKQ